MKKFCFTIKNKTGELEKTIADYKTAIESVARLQGYLKDYARMYPTRKNINKHFYDAFTKRNNGSWDFYEYEIKQSSYDWDGPFQIYISCNFYISKIASRNIDDVNKAIAEYKEQWTENMQAYTKQLAGLYDLDVDALKAEMVILYNKFNLKGLHIWEQLCKQEFSSYDLEK